MNDSYEVALDSALAVSLFGIEWTCDRLAKNALIEANRKELRGEWLNDFPDYYHREASEVIDHSTKWAHPSIEPIRKEANLNVKTIFFIRKITESVTTLLRNSDTETRIRLLNVLFVRGQDPMMDAIDSLASALKENDDSYFFVTHERISTKPVETTIEILNALGLDASKIKKPPQQEQETTNSFLGLPYKHMAKAKEFDAAMWHDFQQAKKINLQRFLD